MAMLPWWIHYPNVNNEIINLDWILQISNENTDKIENFIGVNTIKYADPILWDITSQYEANTIVVDPQTGDAYISTKPVPYGVSLSNTSYWTRIYNYADEINDLQEQIAAANEKLSTTATDARAMGDLVWLNGKLYIITAPMIAGDSYIEGSNCSKLTIEELLGNVGLLNTTDKTNLVAAINEVLATITSAVGDLDSLNTTDKTSVVNAINEVLAGVGDITLLNTTDKTSVVNAINELVNNIVGLKTRPYINVKEFGAVGDGVTDDYQAFSDALTEADEGTTIIIPKGDYYLSSNPETTKIVTWKADNGTTFRGAGIGNPNGGAGKFGCTDIANPWIVVSGEDSKIDITNVVSPIGGGVYANAYEMISDESTPITITGTLTNGSSVITNVSSVEGIEGGYGIIPVPAITGFPEGDSVSNTMRVISISGNDIVMGLDRGGGVGAFTPTVFTGTSGTYTFNIRKRTWQGIHFEGLNTGKVANRDAWHWLYNGVVNLHKQPAFLMELDFNIWDTAEETSRCLALTGIGSGVSPAIALEINRGGDCNWSYGIQIGQASVGLDIGAGEPLYIRTLWDNRQSGNIEPISYGIKFDNIANNILARPLIAGKQIENGAQGLVLQRFTDSSPTGNLISCKQADGNDFFLVQANGFTSVLGLQMLQTAGNGSGLSCTKYLPISDGNGTVYKIMLAE